MRMTQVPIAADVMLRALAAHGVDFFFANPGTDFPPIVEAFARAARGNTKTPRPILVPHENLAVAMAHGAYLMTGRPQAAMMHVNVGTANAINNLTNLARDNAPLLLMAGRTPITEAGEFGSRNRHIHWAQEMFDQGGMVRELVKWDYEFRAPGRIDTVINRAVEMAMTHPRGPIYLALPREPLSAPADDAVLAPPRAIAAPPAPDAAAIGELADWLAAAKNPLIITGAGGREPEGFAAISAFAERWAVPVVTVNPRFLSLPASHPMHFGNEPGALLTEADLIIVLEADVPWFPALQAPVAGCKVAEIAIDPAFQRYPMRTFTCDLAIAATPAGALDALDAALASTANSARVAERRVRLAPLAAKRRAAAHAAGRSSGDRITPAFLSRAISEILHDDDIVFNEYPLVLDQVRREKPGTLFGLSPAGGLGWGLGAALGAKLAAPDRTIVATVGDGAYVFTNPTACHWVSDAFKLPVLTIIFNNSLYGAVRRATLHMFADGAAGIDDGRLLADLSPSPPYEALVAAQGGYARRIERPDELAEALKQARHAVTVEKRQALLNVICT
jgi:acetolactate synthase I/II/III large subunit